MAVCSTDNQDQGESLWFKCDGCAPVWFCNLGADKVIETEATSGRQ